LTGLIDRLRKIPGEVLYLFLAMCITLLGDSSLYVLLPIYAKEIGIPVAAVGVLLSINRFIRLGTNQFVSKLYSKIGSHRLFLVSVILAGITTFLYGLPVGFVIFLISRAVWGGCWSSMRLVCFIKISENSDESSRGIVTGIFNSIVRIGSLVATLLGGVFAELAGYRNTYYIFGLLTLAVCVPLTVLSARQAGSNDVMELDEELEAQDEDTNISNRKGKTEVGLKSVYSMSFLGYWISGGLLSTTIGYILMTRFGTNISILGLSIGIALITSLLTSLKWVYGISLPVVAGRLSARYGRLTLVTFSSVTLVLSLVSIALVKSFYGLSLAIIAAFAASTVLNSVLDILAVDHHSITENGNILGHYMTCGDLGAAFGAVAGYSLAVALGYSNVYIVSAAALVLIFTAASGIIPNRLFSKQKMNI
jgi:MFS family permease